MPPDDPNDTAGMMEWLKQVPPLKGGVRGGPPNVPQEIAGPFTAVAPNPKFVGGAAPPPPAPTGTAMPRIKELDEMFSRRAAETAPSPMPQSPLERQVADPNDARNFAPVRGIMGNRAGYMHPQSGRFIAGEAPLKTTPEDVAFARALESHQIAEAQKMAQRQALAGAAEVAPKLMTGEAQLAQNAFMQSPEGMRLAVIMKNIEAGGTTADAERAVGMLQSAGVTPTEPGAPPLPAVKSSDPVTALERANPRLFSMVYDPRTNKTTADAENVEKFMDKVFAVDNGKLLEQNFPAIQSFADMAYGKDSIKGAVESPAFMQQLERFNPVSKLLSPIGADRSRFPLTSPQDVEGFLRDAEVQRQQRAQVPVQERLWQSLGANPVQAQRNEAFRQALRRYLASPGGTQGGQPPPLPPR